MRTLGFLVFIELFTSPMAHSESFISFCIIMLFVFILMDFIAVSKKGK